MYRYEQEAPFCIQVELCEGCNLVCPFCAISSIRNEDREGYYYQYLSTENAGKIAERIAETGWTSRIEFAMHGEPSMNPKFREIVRIFNIMLKEKNLLIMESNGAGFVKKPLDKIIGMFNAGIDNLALEDYKNVHLIEKIRPMAYGLQNVLRTMGVEIYEYPKESEGNPHQRGKRRKLSFLADISEAASGTHSEIHNSAGLAGKKVKCSEKCAKPFREIAIRWDGSVAICCNDWRGDYKVGNVLETPLKKIWQSDAFNAARLKLYHGQRDFGPCDGCNARSYRVGLLPDKLGKVDLPRPDDEVKQVIKRCLTGKPYTDPVLRPWELVNIKGAK